MQRLERSGIRSISALVDIGNYVMLEIESADAYALMPTNFQAACTSAAREGETLECLNEKTVSLSENMLVVADEKGVLSLAGLMGGAASAVSDDTQNIVLEAAWLRLKSSPANRANMVLVRSCRSALSAAWITVWWRRCHRTRYRIGFATCGGAAGEMVEAAGYLKTNRSNCV